MERASGVGWNRSGKQPESFASGMNMLQIACVGCHVWRRSNRICCAVKNETCRASIFLPTAVAAFEPALTCLSSSWIRVPSTPTEPPATPAIHSFAEYNVSGFSALSGATLVSRRPPLCTKGGIDRGAVRQACLHLTCSGGVWSADKVAEGRIYGLYIGVPTIGLAMISRSPCQCWNEYVHKLQ